MKPQVKVLYKCSCMQDEGHFFMNARGVNEPIEAFMPRLQMQMGIDHSSRNPLCMATSVEYVKMLIPNDGAPVGSV